MKENLVEKYISDFPESVQSKLFELRQLVKIACPDAIESISYGMPAYKLNGKPLIYFAGYKNHIGVYATPNAHKQFEKELSTYKQGKGSVQFPLSQPLPLDLIKKMIEFRIKALA